MKNNKIDFIFIFKLYLDCLIAIKCIYNKVIAIFWPKNSIYDLINIMHRILRLNNLIIEQNIIINYTKFF